MAVGNRGRLPDDWPPVQDATPELLRFQVKEAGRLLYLAAIADDDGLDEDDRELLTVIRENILPEAQWNSGENDPLSGDDALGILLAWHEVAALVPDEGAVNPLWYAARALRLTVWLLGYNPDGLFTPTMRSNAHGDDPESNDPEPRLNQGRNLIEGSMREECVARRAEMCSGH